MAGKSQIPGKYSPNRGSSSIRKLFVLYVTGISLAYGDDRNGSDEPQWASPATLIPGRIKQFSGFATPRPSLLPPGASLMYASIWANWSAWSFCANGVRIRVRACNTIKGFRCTGHNQETRPCEDIEVRPFDPSKSEFRNVIGGDYDVNDPWAEDRLEAMRQLMPSSPTKKIEAGNLHESLSNIEQDPSIVDSELSPSQNQLEKIRRALSGDGDEVVKAATLSLLKKEIRRKMRRRKMGSRVFKPKHGRLQLAAPVFVGSKINTSTSNSTESHEATTANIILPSTPLGIDEILNLKTINLTEQTKSDKKNDGVEGSSTTTQATSITQPSTLSTSPLLNSTGKSIENESTTAIFFPPISPWKPSAIAAITDMETFLKGIIRGNHEDENSSNERSSTESISTSKETTTKATTTETTTATEATTTTKATTTTTRNPLEFQTIPLPAGAEIDADESQSITKKLLKLGIVQTSSSSSKEHIGTSGEPTEIVFPTRKGLKLKTPALTTTLPTTRAIQTLATPATVLKTTSRIDALEEMKQLIAKAKTHKKKPFLKTVQSVRGEVISRIKPKRKGTLHWGEVTIKPASTSTVQLTTKPAKLETAEEISPDTLHALDWMLQNITKATVEADKQGLNTFSLPSTKIIKKFKKGKGRSKKKNMGNFRHRRVFTNRGKKAVQNRLHGHNFYAQKETNFHASRKRTPLVLTDGEARLMLPKAANSKVTQAEWQKTVRQYQSSNEKLQLRRPSADDPIRLFEEINHLQAETDKVEKKMKNIQNST